MADAAAIVLAGGASRRMGRPKALLDWHGTPLVHHVASILAGVCDPVVVVAAPGDELPLPAGVERSLARGGESLRCPSPPVGSSRAADGRERS